MNNTYNDYGFCEDNPGVVKSDVKGIDDKVIGGVYTLQEEERAWKKELKQHIINEHEETREKVNEHTTNEVTEAENVLMNKLDDIDTKLNTASGNILAIKNSGFFPFLKSTFPSLNNFPVLMSSQKSPKRLL